MPPFKSIDKEGLFDIGLARNNLDLHRDNLVVGVSVIFFYVAC